MLPGLLAAAPRGRFTFVVGKGGTGKSTTAAALALNWADAGHAIHLLSTDPAPSIADIFDIALQSQAAPSPCTPLLTLEELDAERITTQWLDRVRAPLEQLVERGTYLDANDVHGLTRLTLPGIDEVAAALRIAELARSATHSVIDTAPTGHTLRLLDAPAMLDSWADVFRAMSDKVATIAFTMFNARVRLPGEAIVEEMQTAAATLRDALRDATFIVITRDDAVVTAETSRLVQALHERGLTIGALVVVGDADQKQHVCDGGHAILNIPRLTVAHGCDGLRAWHEAVVELTSSHSSAHVAEPAGARASTEIHAGGDNAAVRAWLHARSEKLLWFAGKGGTGKSTCAAAVARALSLRGPVLLCSTDPAGSLREVLRLESDADGAEVAPNLRVLQVDAASQLEEWKSRYRSEAEQVFEELGVGGTATLDREIMTSLWDAVPPGIDELFALSEIIDAAETGETIVVDSAPTGHFLRLIESPAMALDWTHAILRILLKYGVAGKLDGFSERVLAFARQLKHLSAMLKDSSASGVFVVTMQNPVVEAQTARLIEALGEAGIAVTARIVNRAARGERSSGPSITTLVAPELSHPPSGLPDLENFLALWELA